MEKNLKAQFFPFTHLIFLEKYDKIVKTKDGGVLWLIWKNLIEQSASKTNGFLKAVGYDSTKQTSVRTELIAGIVTFLAMATFSR